LWRSVCPSRRTALILWLLAGLLMCAGLGVSAVSRTQEARVLETAREMLGSETHNWLIPRVNGHIRLQKPPLAYWLTMLVDRAGDRDGVISEWEARVPPILGGIVLALATFSLAATLFGRTSGFIAGMLLIASGGFFSYTHSARPEMLYAALCTAALACFANAWTRSTLFGDGEAPSAGVRPRPGRAIALWAYAGWALLGLAILAKGPQLPLILVGGWCCAMWFGGQRGEILRTLRPIGGLIIAAAVCLWWFILIWSEVSHSGARMEQETLGRIFDFQGEPLARYLDPYYLYRTAGLLLPWVIPYALALVSPGIREVTMPRAARLLWWLAIFTIALMHVTLNRRWYYLLPLTGVLVALMAWASLAVGQALAQRGRTGAWRSIVALHVAAFAAAIVLLRQADAQAGKPGLVALAAMALIAGTSIVLMWRRRHSQNAVARDFASAVVTALAMLLIAAHAGALWNAERLARRDFVLRIAPVATGQPLLGWRDDWQIAQYYLHRPIPCFNHAPALLALLSKGGEHLLLVNGRAPLQLPADFETTLLERARIDSEDDLQLWRVRTRSARAP